MRRLLEGQRVLDFSQIGAGPTCGMLLADFGADVIKVEPVGGDVARGLGPPWYGDESPIYIAFNRGKRSICLDLKTNEGVDVALRLARECDILIESFRPGVMERLGLGYDKLKEANPKLIYCAVSAYGQDGPFSNRAGVDGILQADSGFMGLIGNEGMEPCKVQAPVVDVFTGYVSALGVLARLFERTRTKQGGLVDVSLFGSALALQQSAITTYLGDREQPAKLGSAAPYSAPNEAFKTKDGWIMIAAYIGQRWGKLCRIFNRPDLVDDPRFITSSDRVLNRSAMRIELNREFGRRPTKEWIPLLETEDILCSNVAEYAEVLRHPQLEYLKLVVGMEHPMTGRVFMPGNPINPREMNRQPYAPPPQKGEHTRAILNEIALKE